jgi:hypothetical protein
MARRFTRKAAAVLLSLAATGCAHAMTVGSYVDRHLDVARYARYDWGPADRMPAGDPRLDRNPFFNDRVQGAIERQLAAKGLILVADASERPDLIIHYHASITERIEVNRVEQTYGPSPEHGRAEIVRFEAGTLIVDMIDAATGRLIWRGWAQRAVADLLNDPDRMSAAIDEAVERMMKRFPHLL